MDQQSKLDTVDFINRRQPSPTLLTGGQPTPKQLQAAADAGVKSVINLRPPSEDAGFDEDALLEGLDIAIYRIPVAGAQDLTRETIEAVDRALTAAGDAPVIVHCGSGNRVGAVMALRAAWLKGANREDAMQVGREHGLTGLADAVEKLLGS